MLNLAFRMTFAHRHLSSCGQPMGATYGVLKTVRDLRENVSRRMVFCWDNGVPMPGAPRPRNWRDDVMTGYKAARKPNDAYAGLVPQLAPLHRALCLLGYDHASVMGLEADDVIGVLSKSAWPDSVKLIFSTDQDYYQLLDEARVHVLVPKKEGGKFRTLYQSDVEREFGIGVGRWAEYLALGGDKSDSIKPMPGMGPKTAVKLIQSGVNLNLPGIERHQPSDFLSKYGGVWETIQKCYSAARVPTSIKDPRIKECLLKASFNGSANKFMSVSPDQSWRNADAKARALREFTAFLADRDMTSLMANARSYFDTESKQTCPQPVSPPVKRTARTPQRARLL